MREVLRVSAYRRLLAAFTLNELAWAIGSLALALLVYRRTGSAFGAMSYFLAAQFIPALLAPFVVARVDQRAIRRVLPALYALEAVVFSLLAMLVSHFALVPVLLLTIIDGVLALTARPLARATVVGVSAPRGLLREGNALINASFSICYMAGPAIGAGVVLAGGTMAALFVNSALFAAIAVTIWTAQGLPDGARAPVPAAGRLRAALGYLRRRRIVRTLIGLQVMATVVFTIGVPVEVVFVQRSLHAGTGGYGTLLSAWGAGAVVGSMAYARWRRRPNRLLISLGAVSLGIGMLVMAAAPSLAIALAGAALAGIANGLEAVAARTALQEQVEPGWLAVIQSVNDSTLQAVPGAGILIGGAIAALAGPRAALAVAGGGALLIAACAWGVLRALEAPAVVSIVPGEAEPLRSEARAGEPRAAPAARR